MPKLKILDEKDKIQTLKEAKRVTKTGGKILVSYYMNDFSVIEYAFVKGHIQESLDEGRLDEKFHIIPKEGDLYSMVRTEDIRRYSELAGLKRIKSIAQDGASDYIRTAITRLSEKDFETYIKYHLSICEREDLLGASSHVLDILEK